VPFLTIVGRLRGLKDRGVGRGRRIGSRSRGGHRVRQGGRRVRIAAKRSPSTIF
jgi:hypothetical protein